MARGHKDYGQGQQTKIIHSVSDLGEHASRLGSPNKYHRGGNVIFQTGFETGFDNVEFESGLEDHSYNLMATPTFSGGMSCRLANGGIVILTRPIELTKVGFEVAFRPFADVSFLEMNIYYDDLSFDYHWQFFAHFEDNQIKLDDEEGDTQVLGTYVFDPDYVNLWYVMKGIVDLETLKYDQIFLNHKNYDCSMYSADPGFSSDFELLKCSFWVYPTDDDIGRVILDNIIITINEQ